MPSDSKRNTNDRSRRSIRFQLLLAVNLTLGTAILGLLMFRYEREMEGEVQEKHASLNDESIAIHGAVRHLLQDHTSEAVQSYIDTVCRRMRESTSPGHHIVVRLNDRVLQAQSHAHGTPELLVAIEKAALAEDHRSRSGNRIVVAGGYTADGVTVFVSENLTNIRRAIRHDVLTQLGMLGLLGVLAAGVVNFVLLRIIGTPLRRLLETVEQIASGQSGAEAPDFGSREMQQLSAAINSMSQSLHENDRERRHQMDKAQQIQQHLLPNGVEIPGLQTAHVFEPADTVAGDYYDFLPLSDGSWLICVADVTGHGVPAAMGAAMLKSLLMAASEQPPFEPLHILQEINRRFVVTVLPGNFASMFLGRWQPELRDLSWASAGHEPGIVLTACGRLDQLSSTGLLLGIDPDATWEQRCMQLTDGDRVLLFSDGATETRSSDGELFGRERLTANFSKCSEVEPQAALTRIQELLDTHRESQPLSDDLTLVALHCSTPRIDADNGISETELSHPQAVEISQ